MEQGPVTAGEIAAALALSAPAVRRHLDALIADGEAEAREAPSRGRRRRGRPARGYLLTTTGRDRFGHTYDDLAVAALRYLAEHGGPDAVEDFARSRARDLIGAAAPAVVAGAGPGDRAGLLAEALTERGYAAQARAAGSGDHRGVQLCQHHCPVAHVAAEFPALCEAETDAIAEVLGTHVQRLATIARGHSACTTHVPLGIPDARREHETHHDSPGAPGGNVPRGRQSAHDDRS
ncbi:MAG: ArsR family transcriptional regulator [Pseudonocardia sp.]|nr:ArsR family transcriptional regulator [Pseudonocardia sp.]